MPGKSIRAGDYDHRVKWQRPPDPEGATSSSGQPSGAWRDIVEVWCSVAIVSSAESTEGDQQVGRAYWRFRCRYSEDIAALDTTCRGIWTTRAGGPKTVYVDRIERQGERGAEVWVWCQEFDNTA